VFGLKKSSSLIYRVFIPLFEKRLKKFEMFKRIIKKNEKTYCLMKSSGSNYSSVFKNISSLFSSNSQQVNRSMDYIFPSSYSHLILLIILNRIVPLYPDSSSCLLLFLPNEFIHFMDINTLHEVLC
jgi:hypothetical protein